MAEGSGRGRSSKWEFNIGKVCGNVNAADTMTFNYTQDGTQQTGGPPDSGSGGGGGKPGTPGTSKNPSRPSGFAESADGSLQQDGSMTMTCGGGPDTGTDCKATPEQELNAPTQESSLGDQQQQQVNDDSVGIQQRSRTPTPVAAEGTSEFISANRDDGHRDVTTPGDDVQGAAGYDPTAMQELKPRQNALDVNELCGDLDDDVESRQDRSLSGHDSMETYSQAAAEATTPKQRVSNDTNNPDSESRRRELEVAQNNGSQNYRMLHPGSQDDSATQRGSLENMRGGRTSGNDQGTRGTQSHLAQPPSISSTTSESLSFTSISTSSLASATNILNSIDPDVRLDSRQTQSFSSFGQSGPASLPSLPSGYLPQNSLTVDGGESLDNSGDQQEILVIHHQGVLRQDDSRPPVAVVDFSTNGSMLRTAEQDGCFSGAPDLLRATWLGHRDFSLTKWKLAHKPTTAVSPSQLQVIIKHICRMLLDREVSTLRAVLMQMKQTHSAFLQSLHWDDGLVILLGHANPQKGEECMQSPKREEIMDVLKQLLPDGDFQTLSWEDPGAVERVDVGGEERGVQNQHRLSSPPRSYGDRSSRNQALPREDSGLSSSSPTESDLGAYGGAVPQSGRIDRALLERLVDERVSDITGRQSQQEEILKALQEQWQQGIQEQAESHQSELRSMAERMQSLQQELQMLRQRDPSVETRQMVSEMVQAERGQQNRSSADEHFQQEQTQRMAEFQRNQYTMSQDLIDVKKQRDAQNHSVSELQKTLKKMAEDQKEMRSKHEQELLKIKRDLEYKVHKMQESLDQRSQDIETGKDLSLQVAEDDIRTWCTKFEARGQRALESCLVQIKEMNLQRRELDAQRDRNLDANLQNFNAKLLSRVDERERRIRNMADSFHAYLVQNDLDMQAKQQAILMDMYKMRKEYADTMGITPSSRLEPQRTSAVVRSSSSEPADQDPEVLPSPPSSPSPPPSTSPPPDQDFAHSHSPVHSPGRSRDRRGDSESGGGGGGRSSGSGRGPRGGGGAGSGGHTYTVGMALHSEPQRQVSDVRRAGGNMYSTALADCDRATSKMQGKHEDMSNEMSEKMRMAPIPDSATTSLAWKHGPFSLETMSSVSETMSMAREAVGSGKVNGPKVPDLAAQGTSVTESVPRHIDDDRDRQRASSVPASSTRTPESPGRNAQERQEIPTNARSNDKTSPPPERKAEQTRGNSLPRETPLPHQETPTPPKDSRKDEEDLSKAEQFLDWVNVHGNLPGSSELQKILSRNVNEALKPETKPAPRAKCMDTILCLDVSESIVQAGDLGLVKQTALTFIDGIEDLMDEMDLEENIAVVVMGGNARVIQHLTNDLTLVREAIESLNEENTGGRSPFMQALLVCLAANKGRGGVVNISGVHKVRPRIIFISDGCPTDEAQFSGSDIQSNVNQVKFSLVQVLSQLASKKRRSTPRPINCVPIGKKADTQFLQSMAQLGGGQLVPAESIRNLCRYYKMQQMIGRLFKMVKNHDYEDDKIRDVLKAIAADSVTEEEKEEILCDVKKLKACPPEEDEPDADDFNYVLENEEQVKKGQLLALGTRVVRGPDWKWDNQDTEGPGTVINHSRKDKDNWIYVKWDNGTSNAYRYNEDGKSDIAETQHQPRLIPADSIRLDFGVRVVRGPDWKSLESFDEKGPGSVIRVRNSDGKVKVRWDKTGKVSEHNFNEHEKEVQLHMPEFPRNHKAETVAEKAQEDDKDKVPVWQWHDSQQQWRTYNQEVCDKLEMEYKRRPSGSCIILRSGFNRRVSFKTPMHEKSVDDGGAVEVRREMVDEERKNDLLAIELSLEYS